jgi:sulfonate transport system substrate-binding protein
MKRTIFAAGLLLGAMASATAQTTLRVGDQKGNSQAVMEAAGVLKDVPYKIEWKEFPAAAPLLEALGAGAIETGLVGDAPFTFAAAANVPVKAIGAIRQSREGLAVLVSRESPIHGFEDLKGKKIATGRGSIGHQLLLAALESRGWSAADVQIVFLAPSDAKVAYTQGSVDAWSTWEPYVSQEEVLFQSRRVITAEGLTPGIGFQVASPNAIRDKRPELEDFLRRLTAARAWSLTNVNAYAETWGTLMNIPPAVPLNWLSRAKIRMAPIDDGVVADEQKTIDLYFRSGLIKQQLNAAASIVPSPMPSGKPLASRPARAMLAKANLIHAEITPACLTSHSPSAAMFAKPFPRSCAVVRGWSRPPPGPPCLAKSRRCNARDRPRRILPANRLRRWRGRSVCANLAHHWHAAASIPA